MSTEASAPLLVSETAKRAEAALPGAVRGPIESVCQSVASPAIDPEGWKPMLVPLASYQVTRMCAWLRPSPAFSQALAW